DHGLVRAGDATSARASTSSVQAEDGIRDRNVTGVQTCALPIFLGAPKGWKGPVVDFDGGAPALKEAAAQAGVTLFVHAPYVLNVASLNNRIRIPSRKLLQKHVDLATEIGAAGVVVHGGHVRADEDEEVGFDNWRKAVDQLEAGTPIFIENTAGGQHAMARGVAKLTRLWEAVRSA